MNHSLRLRLVMSVLTLLLPASLAAGVLLVEVFGNRLLRDFDVALEEEATTVAELLPDLPDAAAIDALLAHIAAEADLGAGKRVVVRRGNEVIDEAPAGSAQILAGGGGAFRSATAVSGPPNAPLTVVVAVPATAALHATRRLTWLLAASIPTGLLVIGAGLWVVMGRALRPLETAAERMDALGAGDLRAHVPLDDSSDEVGRIVAAVNRMLDRVAASIAELQRFTTDAAHELRTPLAVLRAGLEVTLTRERPADEYRAALTEALDETERLRNVAEDLLTLARLEASPAHRPIATVRLDEMLHELADAWATPAGQGGIEIAVQTAPRLDVDGAAADLYRLFANLIDNALRHTPAGGRVTLRSNVDDGNATITVTDTGSGIAPEDLSRVFDRFYRGRGERGPGTGLGLSIARAIAQAHGGALRLTNGEAGGCEASVVLPLSFVPTLHGMKRVVSSVPPR